MSRFPYFNRFKKKKNLCHLEAFRSTRLDDIPTWFVKDAVTVLSIKPIAYFVNLSLMSDILCDQLKSSRGLYIDIVMFYLQKAFDTVDHQIICNTLQATGISNFLL